MKRAIAFALAATLTLPGLALAQTDHSRMDHSTTEPGAAGPTAAMADEEGADENGAEESPVRAAFEAANARMHEDMDVELTGNADVDFARGMIPHHRGAIEMAEIELEHGRDPELRALAQEIIEAQEAEIAQLEAWLEANDPDGAPAQ